MKKLLFSTLFILSYFGIAQSSVLDKNEKDEFTGTVTKLTNKVLIGNAEKSIYGNLRVILGKVGETYALYAMSSYDLGCSGAKSNYIYFLFEDGSSIKYDKDFAKIDCDDINISVFLVNINDFEGKVVKKIRYAKSQSYQDYLWTHESNMNDFFTILN